MEPPSSAATPEAAECITVHIQRTSPVTSRTNASQVRRVELSPNANDSRELRQNSTIERLAERARRQFEELLWSLDPSELRDIASAIEQDSHHGGGRKRRRTSDTNTDKPTRTSPLPDVESSGSTSISQGSEADICIRCFRNWAKAIDANEDIVECVTDRPKRRKCEICSVKRISCEFIPYEGAKTLRRLKSRMDHASSADKATTRKHFEEEYWKLSDYIYEHPVPAEIERKAKQRAHKRAQRRTMSQTENRQEQGKEQDIYRTEHNADTDEEEDTLLVEAQIRQETEGTW